VPKPVPVKVIVGDAVVPEKAAALICTNFPDASADCAGPKATIASDATPAANASFRVRVKRFMCIDPLGSCFFVAA
jgi:hypothetical protein